MLTQISGNLGALVVAGGGGAAVALAVVRAFGTKWLDNKFNARLEALRHENTKETERLKLEVSRILDRATKLNQREFEVLPQMWEAVVDAVSAAKIAYMRFSQNPDLERIPDEKLRALLGRLKVPEHHQEEILEAEPKLRNQMLGRSQSIEYVNDAYRKTAEAQRLAKRGSIFLPPDLRDRFLDLLDLVHNAVIDADMRGEDGVKLKDLEHAPRLRKEGDALLSELETMVRARFQSGLK